MADPKGFLVVPVAYRADGTIHALELDTSDRLKVLVDSITGSVTVVQTTPANLTVANYDWDGSTWQKMLGQSSGLLKTGPLHHAIWNESGVTRITKQASATNTTATIYTVPANKSFYLTSLVLSLWNTTAGIRLETVILDDATPTTQMTWTIGAAASNVFSYPVPLTVPLLVPAGWAFKAVSIVATTGITGMITGYEM